MISYYTSKHPGLYLYLALISISVLAFTFLEITAPVIGILSMLWGLFMMVRILSLYEVSEHQNSMLGIQDSSKRTNHKSSALPYDLLRRMNGKNHFNRGIFALNALHGRTVLWFVLACVYALYSTYLTHQAGSNSIHIFETLSIFFMIGAAFWSGQTYAYSDFASKLILTVSSIAFSIHLFQDIATSSNMHDVYYIYTIETLLSFCALIGYSVLILLYTLKHSFHHFLTVLGGLSVIASMILCVYYIPATSQNPALWISGWSLFSVFWTRASCHTEKIYVLYQCQ